MGPFRRSVFRPFPPRSDPAHQLPVPIQLKVRSVMTAAQFPFPHLISGLDHERPRIKSQSKDHHRRL